MDVRVFCLILLPYVSTLKTCDPDDVSCLLRHDNRSIVLHRVRPTEDAQLVCGNASTTTASRLEWWVARRRTLLAAWRPSNATTIADNSTYTLNEDGTLVVRAVNQHLVEE